MEVDGSSSYKVSGSTEPSRWRCSSAFGTSRRKSSILNSQVLMTGEEIEAIVNGYHGDAFRILGPHSVRKKNGQPRWEVRAFLPQADSAVLRSAAGDTAMEKKHPQGFFVGCLDGEPAPYTLRIRLWDGS